MADSNRNLAAKALILVGDVAKAMGPPFDRQARTLLPAAVGNFADNKKQVRGTGSSSSSSWVCARYQAGR